VGNDWDRATARTVGTGQVKVDEYLASAGDTFWVQRQTAPTSLGGTAVTLNDTAPTNDRWNMTTVEVLPSEAGGEEPPPDVTPPAVSLTAPAGGATLSGTVGLAASAADASGIAGVQFLLDGNPVGSEDTTAPYELGWDSTAVADGSHTIAARARDGAGNTATSSPVAVTVKNASGGGGPSSLALDTTVTTHQTTGGSTISAPALTTAGPGETLLAFVSSDGPSTSGSQSITAISGGGLTWTLRRRANAQPGTAEVWQAAAPAKLTSVTITATRASSGYQGAITVAAFSGADTGSGGATASGSAASGAPSISLSTTRAGSMVWGVGDDWTAAASRTVGAGQALVDQFLSSSGDTFWTQRRTATVPSAGTSVSIDDTAPTSDRWNLAAVEVLAAP
jgi:hypothetical protein